MNKIVEREMHIGPIIKKIKYNEIEELPSEKRLYSDIGKIYVRGFFYNEVLEISKNIDDSLKASIRFFKDAIQFENTNYSLEDLELVDYIFLTSIVNILTNEDLKWYPEFTCSNIIKNPKLKKIENDIEDIEAKIEILKEALKKETPEQKKLIKEDISNYKKLLKTLDDKLKNFSEDKEVICKASVMTPITMDDLEFIYENENIMIPSYVKISDIELEISPLTVKDYIEIEDIEDDLTILAKYIKNFTLNDAVEILKYSMSYEVEKISEIINQMEIKLKPIKTRCQRCGAEYELDIQLTDIKVLPII